MSRDYDRDTVIYKLERKGMKISPGLIEIPKNVDIGIKMWGTIDFLGLPWRRVASKGRRRE